MHSFFTGHLNHTHNMANKLLFKHIESQDMPLIWQYLSRNNSRSCDFSYGGIFMWVDYFEYEYAICHDTLFIKGKTQNHPYSVSFSLPIGSLSLSDATKLLKEYCREQNITLILSAIPEEDLPRFCELSPTEITELSDWADYVYDASSLAILSGKKLSKKRNHVNKFTTLYPNADYSRITSDNIHLVKAFMKRLCLTPAPSTMAAEERILASKMIETVCSNDNPMIGGMLHIGSKVVAYTIGDIKNDTLFIHIEKADRLIPGSYESINKYFAVDITSNYPQVQFINREDDAGDPGLRKAKLSYHPSALIRKFNIRF